MEALTGLGGMRERTHRHLANINANIRIRLMDSTIPVNNKKNITATKNFMTVMFFSVIVLFPRHYSFRFY